MVGVVMIGDVGIFFRGVKVVMRMAAIRMDVATGHEHGRCGMKLRNMRPDRQEGVQKHGDGRHEGGDQARRSVVSAVNHAAIDNRVRICTQETNLTHPVRGDRSDPSPN
jgi:hypothetical protein